MHRRAASASAAVLLLIGCGAPSSVDESSPEPTVHDAPPTHQPSLPAASDGPPAHDTALAIGRNDGLVEFSLPPVVGPPAESERPDPSPVEFHPTDVPAEPFVPTRPDLDADPTAVAAFVAEAWASTGVPELHWPGGVEPFFVAGFDADAISVDPVLGSGPVRIAQAVAIDAAETPSGQRAVVTLEELTTIDDQSRWRLLVVEVLLIHKDGRWLVASLEVLG